MSSLVKTVRVLQYHENDTESMLAAESETVAYVNMGRRVLPALRHNLTMLEVCDSISAS